MKLLEERNPQVINLKLIYDIFFYGIDNYDEYVYYLLGIK